MRQYIVDLADRVTGQGQQIAVLAEDTDTMENIQEFVDQIEDLKIKNPVVINFRVFNGILIYSELPEAV